MPLDCVALGANPFLKQESLMKTQDFVQLEEQYGAHNYHPLDVVI
jgi:hypothetical protein